MSGKRSKNPLDWVVEVFQKGRWRIWEFISGSRLWEAGRLGLRWLSTCSSVIGGSIHTMWVGLRMRMGLLFGVDFSGEWTVPFRVERAWACGDGPIRCT
ncbi:hypothetical protein ACFX1Q_007268 [Malus domestica]